MSVPVTIENEALRLEVWPQFGGKVGSILDKADKFELLFDYAAELPTGPQYGRPYAEGWHAGWDECFPAVASGPYPGHPYDGVSVPDHGELWGLPAVATPARDGISTVWHGLRFGYTFTRKLFLEGATIVAEYALVNHAPFDFHFVWAQHALLCLPGGVELDLGAKSCRLSHDAPGREVQADFDWPSLSQGLDFSRPSSLPLKQGWKFFTTDAIRSSACVRYPSRGRRLRIEYASPDKLPAYWGVWINTGGWMGHKHFAIEPTTGRFDQLHRSFRDGSAGRVQPSSRREWSVRWTVA